MTPKYRRIFRAILIITFISFVAQVCILPTLPDTIPIHWNASGEIDGYGPKWMALLLAALPMAMILLMRVMPKIDPKRESYEKHMDVYIIVTILVALLLLILSWVVILAAENAAIPTDRIVPGLLGALFAIIGNYMPRIRHNYSFGIRTSWTLASETVWKKTHRLGGILFVICGTVMVLQAVFPSLVMVTLSMGLLIGTVIFLTVYSWYAWKKEQEK